jgi:hypothetical protein
LASLENSFKWNFRDFADEVLIAAKFCKPDFFEYILQTSYADEPLRRYFAFHFYKYAILDRQVAFLKYYIDQEALYVMKHNLSFAPSKAFCLDDSILSLDEPDLLRAVVEHVRLYPDKCRYHLSLFVTGCYHTSLSNYNTFRNIFEKYLRVLADYDGDPHFNSNNQFTLGNLPGNILTNAFWVADVPFLEIILNLKEKGLISLPQEPTASWGFIIGLQIDNAEVREPAHMLAGRRLSTNLLWIFEFKDYFDAFMSDFYEGRTSQDILPRLLMDDLITNLLARLESLVYNKHVELLLRDYQFKVESPFNSFLVDNFAALKRIAELKIKYPSELRDLNIVYESGEFTKKEFVEAWRILLECDEKGVAFLSPHSRKTFFDSHKRLISDE